MITITIRLLAFIAAAACASGAVLAQTAPGFPADPEQRLLKQIDLLRREDGSTAEELIGPLRALALQYQEGGDHALAIVALQEARQVMRVNYGLSSSSVDDALLLQQQIRSEKALGHAGRVWDLQQDLIGIARQHLDDLRMLPVFLDLIDDRTGALDAFQSTDFVDLPPGLYVPCEPSPPRAIGDKRDPPIVGSDARTCPFGSWRTVIASLQLEIVTHYAEAIEVLVKNGDFASQDLRILEREAMRLRFGGFDGCSGGTLDVYLKMQLVG